MESDEVKPHVTAKQLCAKYGLDAEHCLYRADGKWYHVLKQFPGILFDGNGFIRFSNHKEFSDCAEMRIYPDTDQVVAPEGISNIPGYIGFDSLQAKEKDAIREFSSGSESAQNRISPGTDIGTATFLDPTLTFAASSAFTIVAELMQRISSSFRVHPRITFPCGGFYHCLSLFDAEDENIADLSLSTGRFHPFKALTHVAEQWPEPRSYCLAAVGQGYGIERVSKEILAVLGLPSADEPDRSMGIAYRAIGMLLGRFMHEDGITIENGYRTGDKYPGWILEAPEDWRGETFGDYVAGQLWRIENRSTSQSVIIDDCVDMALLVGKDAYVGLSRDIRTAVDTIERFLRGETVPPEEVADGSPQS
jgi:hypothetical protein